MIATVRFEYAGSPCEATLSDLGEWSSRAAPAVEGILNALILGASTSPSEGMRYWRHARKMAEMLHGAVDYARAAEETPGRVY
jgi:hypothetical protein